MLRDISRNRRLVPPVALRRRRISGSSRRLKDFGGHSRLLQMNQYDTSVTRKLKKPFFIRPDVLSLARELLGKHLFTNFGGTLTGGIITETEAYRGTTDRASHAHGGKITKRNRIMYMAGGTAYVYLCYGMHHLFNIVTNSEGIPDAVLIRAILPTHGIDTMLKRRNLKTPDKSLTIGPGRVSQALGITTGMSGTSLTGHRIWLEDRGIRPQRTDIITGPRVGVDYAGAHAKLPWRFILKKADGSK